MQPMADNVTGTGESERDEKAHKDELRDGIHHYPALQQEGINNLDRL